ncbi:hypothetical protein LJR153_007242 [Paenibacillus sp. LjRoot153]|uniref:hypothetical protein n=1 Tax=Paenibacillus sp. LjRoot153 TaxID=3342270 RepID=UPI003ECEB5DD
MFSNWLNHILEQGTKPIPNMKKFFAANVNGNHGSGMIGSRSKCDKPDKFAAFVQLDV